MGLTKITVGSLTAFLGISANALRLINLLKCFQTPTLKIPNRCEAIIAINANAKVVFKSAVPPRRYGTNASSPSSTTTWPIVPTPGKSPNQLFNKIKMKKAKISGKNCADLAREPVMESKVAKNHSIAIS